MIYYCAPEMESFLGTTWNLGEFEETDRNLTDKFSNLMVTIPHFEYWAYLRHHGFPSPLLDWSKSPFYRSLLCFL